MKKVLKIIITALITFFVIVLTFAINFGIIDKLIIKNACDYDITNVSHGLIFNLFYEISSNTGYHPEPSYFNFVFTIISGLLIGIYISYKLIWKRKKVKSTNAQQAV